MKSDFLLAITQLSAEKNLPKEVVLEAVESALASAFRKESFAANQNIVVKINPASGAVQVWASKTVVEKPADMRREIALDKARQIKPDVLLGDVIEVEATPRNAGRIAAQTAKQVILQRLHEAEHSAIFEEYAGREGEMVSGVVQHIEPKQVFIDLGRAEAVLPVSEQARNERYRVGQRLKVYILEVARGSKGPRVVVSRSHPGLLRRLLELEVPEVSSGAVEFKSIAREAGYRSKVAVAAQQEGIDPVGCCVGLRGIRIQNIVSELNGEKLDVIMWDPASAVFIANALNPAQVLSVRLDEQAGIATVVVSDRQLSLAIGKEGQNARLAAKLTGWRIDIKSASAAEAERLAVAEVPARPEVVEKALVEEGLKEEVLVGVPVATDPVVPVEEEIAETVDDTTLLEEVLEPEPVVEEEFIPFEPQIKTEKGQIRFAEDLLLPRSMRPQSKSKKRKKSGRGKGGEEDGVKLGKLRRVSGAHEDEEEF